ncbi:lipopolysaccharide biosynthesis [Cylindrospermum sp. NIES-4074]|nr:lipopolysaccharide biosynthesis [Cylindrospermum sp. NIES-4074]
MDKSFSSLPAVLQRRWLPALAVFISVVGSSFVYLAITPRLYQVSTRLMLDDNRVSVSELGRDLTQVPAGTPGGPSPLADQAELVKSQPILEQALAKVSPQARSQRTINEINKNLQVKIVPATNILVINYQDQSPIKAAELVNAVAQAMVKESAEQIRKEAASVQQFLEKEVPLARQRLEKAESVENKYRRASRIISFADQSKSLVDSLAALEDQERTLLAQLQEVRSRNVSLRQITAATNLSDAYTAVRGGQDEQLIKLRGKLADLETQLINARLRFTENHPTVMSLLRERQALHNLYNQQLSQLSPKNSAIPPDNVASDTVSQNLTSQLITNEIERLAIENKLRTVQSLKANLQNRLAQLPIQQQPLTAFTRQREAAAASLKLLQGKLEEARIAEAQQVGNIRIIEAAIPPTAPTFPKPSLVLLLAFVLGTILAIGAVLLLEVIDNTIHSAAEAEELLKIPLLGTLPSLTVNTLTLQSAAGFLDDMTLVEPYRMLLKNLEFRHPQKLRSIVVTSTIPGEGKSLVVSHLAAVSAMLSRQTLVVDADLYRPMQHQLFNLAPQPGVTNVLNRDKSLLKAVQMREMDHLSVLTCGELHQRPSQLLESGAMQLLITEAIAKYNLVIIDTPPLSVTADAATLSKYTDGIILIIRPNFTPKEMLQKAVAELTQNRIPILGIVVNEMTNQTEQTYRYLSRPMSVIKHTANSSNGVRSR